MTALHKPAPADWDLWSQMGRAELWEAVVLSLDASPSELEVVFNWLFGSQDGIGREDRLFQKEFRRRMKIAESNVCASGPIRPLNLNTSAEDYTRAPVNLPEFGDWAIRLKWTLPDGFPRESRQADPKKTLSTLG